MSLPTFTDYYKTIKAIEECFDKNDGTFEHFFEMLEEKNLDLEQVMTGDIAGMTLPMGSMRRRNPNLTEVAPEGEKAEEFITKNKAAFKKRYGDNWERVLYATAWKLFGDKKD